MPRSANPIFLAVLAVCFATQGCSWLGLRGRSPAPEPRCELPDTPTCEEVVEYLNRNIAKVPAWRCMDGKLSSPGQAVIPVALNATIAVEQPQNLRMTAGTLLGDEVDLGSNAERLWFWNRHGGDRRVYTARHSQPQAEQRLLPIPFHPDWFVEALGVIPIDASEASLQISEADPRQANLIRRRTAPNGEEIKMVTVVDIYRGVILEHQLRRPNGDLIAEAKLFDYRQVPQSSAVLPHKIELKLLLGTAGQLGVTLTMGKIEVNPPMQSSRVFRMPEIANSPPFDIGAEMNRRGRPLPPPIPRSRAERSPFDPDTQASADSRPGAARVSGVIEE